MTTGERLKIARENAGLTQTELGKKIGVSGVAIMRYEKGTRQPRVEQLQRIAAALDIHILDLVGIGEELDKFTVELENVKSAITGKPIPPEEIPEILELFKGGCREVYDSLDNDQKAEFWNLVTHPLFFNLEKAFNNLNELGKTIAVERVQELGKIPEYCADTTEKPQPVADI